jgi:putative ABC transport system permease protein
MIIEAIRIALTSIWGNKSRSFLTMLGIIIGISSVVMFMSLGEGLRREVTNEITSLGSNVLTIIPGQLSGSGVSTNVLSGDVLKGDDVKDLKALPSVKDAATMSLVGGTVRNGTKPAPTALVMGTSPNFLELYNMITIDKGRIFTPKEDADKGRVVVLGPAVAKTLFDTEEPVNKTITIGKDVFTVIGVTGIKSTSSLIGGDLGSMTLIPRGTADDLAGGEKIYRIIVKLNDGVDAKNAKDVLKSALLVRDSEEDFSVLSPEDVVGVVDTVLNLLTAAISGIAAISLLVAGVGIMNIMLVSVTERTKEIGIRKAVGATTNAILLQFIIESVFLSCLGAIIAVGLSYGVDQLIIKYSTLTPVITGQAVMMAVGVGVMVGLIFGIAPAYRAAKLDPIKALRWE